jgi:hypothetical protein
MSFGTHLQSFQHFVVVACALAPADGFFPPKSDDKNASISPLAASSLIVVVVTSKIQSRRIEKSIPNL